MEGKEGDCEAIMEIDSVLSEGDNIEEGPSIDELVFSFELLFEEGGSNKRRERTLSDVLVLENARITLIILGTL